VLADNLDTAFLCSRAVVPAMMQARWGRIINVSSIFGRVGAPNAVVHYSAAKAAVIGFTRQLATELGPFGITVNAIAPGAIETPINTALLHNPAKLHDLLGQIPLGRLGQPNDVAGIAAFLASSDADYMTGTTVFVDGGLLWNYHEQ
jgi:glucose 1-dehydrogenase